MLARLAIASMFAVVGCAAPSVGPAPVAQLAPASFNTEPWVGTQTPSGPYVTAGQRTPFQTLNSLPPGAATTVGR